MLSLYNHLDASIFFCPLMYAVGAPPEFDLSKVSF